jgi:hypothetical protein
MQTWVALEVQDGQPSCHPKLPGSEVGCTVWDNAHILAITHPPCTMQNCCLQPNWRPLCPPSCDWFSLCAANPLVGDSSSDPLQVVRSLSLVEATSRPPCCCSTSALPCIPPACPCPWPTWHTPARHARLGCLAALNMALMRSCCSRLSRLSWCSNAAAAAAACSGALAVLLSRLAKQGSPPLCTSKQPSHATRDFPIT